MLGAPLPNPEVPALPRKFIVRPADGSLSLRMVEATTYRAKALRLRSEAERMADARIKRRLLDIAQQYDDLARLVAASYLRVVNS